MPISVKTDSMAKPHALIVAQLRSQRTVKPVAGEWKCPVSGMLKGSRARVYMRLRKMYAAREERKRIVRVVGRVKRWPWREADAWRMVKVLNVKVRSWEVVSCFGMR